MLSSSKYFFLNAICFILFVFNNGILSQITSPENWHETGVMDIQNFKPAEYGGGTTNHDVIMDERGILYFANNSGILEYDGEDWRLIRLPGNKSVRSLCNHKGVIYVGAQNDFGYLKADLEGSWQFISLKTEIPDSLEEVKNIWETVAVGDSIFFRGYYKVFCWVGGKMTVLKPQTLFHNAYSCNETFFVRQNNIGLMQLGSDSLFLVPGGEQFKHQGIAALLPYQDDKILILTRFDGWYIYDGQSICKMITPADEFMRESLVYKAVLLPGDKIAVATHRRGLALMNIQGQLLRVIDKSSGLRDKTLTSLLYDNQHGVWVGLNNGLARIEIDPLFSRFDERTGLEGVVSDVTRFQDKIYAATNLGVYYLDTEKRPIPRFEKVDGISNMAWTFLPMDDFLLAGTHLGLYRILGDNAYKLNDGINGLTVLKQSRKNKDQIYAGLYNNLLLINMLPDNSANYQILGQVGAFVVDIEEEQGQGIWVGTRKGLYLVKPTSISEGEVSAETIHYGKSHGLPESYIYPEEVDGRMVFASSKGLYRFDGTKQRFFQDSSFGEPFADSTLSFRVFEKDYQGNIWVFGRKREKTMLGVLRHKQINGYQWFDQSFDRLADQIDISAIYPATDGTSWICGSDELIRYSPSQEKTFQEKFPVIIRRVKLLSWDSLIYNGGPLSTDSSWSIEYKDHSLRFRFSTPWYDFSSGNRYQVCLQGFDEAWSSWQTANYNDYTALSPGAYTFHVRAKNIYSVQSEEAAFHFIILAPWYLTSWAYLLYFLLAVVFVMFLIKIRIRQLYIRNQTLEALIADRTQTVQEQANKLKEMNALKSRFFANISHEFRTPLTLILGPLDEFDQKAENDGDRAKLGMIKRNATRLLDLINQLLDLSRLESGGMIVQASTGDFSAYLKGIVMSFASLAEQKRIHLRFESKLPWDDKGEQYFDRDKVDKIITNLLANALKFTPAGGNVTVLVHPEKENERIAVISISDDGPGIASEKQAYIFDRFYQGDSASNRRFEGTGIGLALVKELAEVHYGTIGLESEEGSGTTFTVKLPLHRSFFQPGELIDQMTVPEPVDQKQVSSSSKSEFNSLESDQFEEIKSDETLILIVEDHEDVRRYINEHLQKNYRIIEAVDGSQGFDLAVQNIPDLVVSDVMMPDTDGYELCKNLKTEEKTSHIPVILLTARADENSKMAGLDTGADDYLIKPFNPKELKTRIRNLIEQRRKLRRRFQREALLQPETVNLPSTEISFIKRLLDLIDRHIADENFNVDQLSQMLNMSRRQTLRKIKAISGESPTDFIRSMRLKKAHQLISQNTGTISEIAFRVGFNNLSYFSRSFRNQFGYLPSDLIK